ncbi:hypothetical protein ABKN59_008037 [Abortiporus biennis]
MCPPPCNSYVHLSLSFSYSLTFVSHAMSAYLPVSNNVTVLLLPQNERFPVAFLVSLRNTPLLFGAHTWSISEGGYLAPPYISRFEFRNLRLQ